MATTAILPLSATRISTGTVDTATLPEVEDGGYFSQVLHLPASKTENEYDEELRARATALGITIPQPPPPTEADQRNTSSARSASTVVTFHARTFSAGSGGSGSTALTDLSSLFGPPSPVLKATDGSTKAKSKVLSYSQYEKYLATLSPALDQPKMRKASGPAVTNSSRSLFSVRTGKSFASMKSGLKTKLRWRRRSIQPFELAVYVP